MVQLFHYFTTLYISHVTISSSESHAVTVTSSINLLITHHIASHLICCNPRPFPEEIDMLLYIFPTDITPLLVLVLPTVRPSVYSEFLLLDIQQLLYHTQGRK